MRFCPHCGAPLMAGAKFCVECGKAVSDAGSGARKDAPPKPPSTTGVQLTAAFIVVFLSITILGLGAAAYLYLRPFAEPPPPPQVATALPPQAPSEQTSAQEQSAAPAAGGSQSDAQLPPGHPKISCRPRR